MRFKEYLKSFLIAMLGCSYVLKGGEQSSINILTDFTVLIVLILMIYSILTFLLNGFKINSIDKYIYLISIYIMINAIPDMYIGNLKVIFEAFKWMLLSVSMIYIIRINVNTKRELNNVMNAYVILNMIVFFDILLNYKIINVARILYKNVHPVSLSYFFALAIPYLVQKIMKGSNIKIRIPYMLALLVNIYMILTIGTKSTLIGLIIVLFIQLIVMFDLKKYLKSIFIGVIIFFTVFILLGYQKNIDLRTMQRLMELTTDQSTFERIVHYRLAIENFKSSPIFGVNDRISGIYPHNIFLEIAMEHGIIGLSILSIIIMKTFSKVRLTDRYINQTLLLIFLGSMVSFSFYDNKYLYFSLGLFLANYHMNKNSREEEL